MSIDACEDFDHFDANFGLMYPGRLVELVEPLLMATVRRGKYGPTTDILSLRQVLDQLPDEQRQELLDVIADRLMFGFDLT